MASASLPQDVALAEAQRQQLLQYIDLRIQELEEERRALRQHASDLDAERGVIEAKIAEARGEQTATAESDFVL